jgi:hypothetical protein
MSFSLRRGCFVAVTALCVFALPAAMASAADRDIIRQARNAYYSLQARDFVDLRCNVTPNWRAILQEQLKTNPAAVNRAADLLKQLVFVVTLASGEPAKITHNMIAAANDKMAQGLQQIYSGMAQMVVGFFATWTGYVVTPLLPAADDNYQLQEQGGRWRLSYKEGPTDVVTIMEKDFSIDETTVDAPGFVSVLRPKFTRTSEGLLLTEYSGDYRGKSPNAPDAVLLQVLIAYQQVNGLQLPSKLNISGSQNGQPFQVEVVFSGCTATKHYSVALAS